MAPIDVYGTESYGASSLLPEVAVQERNLYEGKNTGNTAISKILEKDSSFPVITETNAPEKLSSFEQSEANADLMRSVFDEPVTRAILNIFGSELEGSERSLVADKIQSAIEGKTLIAMYGTSGTEENSKEIGNTNGMVSHMDKKVKPTTGLYFVEDYGHPFIGVVNDEIKFWAQELKSSGTEEAKAQEDAENAINCLYLSEDLGIYDPEKETVQQFLEYVDAENRAQVSDSFRDLNERYKSGNRFMTVAANLKAPTSSKVKESFEILGIGEDDASFKVYSKVAEYIEQNIPNANVGDFKTIVQGYLMLKNAYDAYGAEEMPLVLTCKWSTVCDITNVKTSTRIHDAAEAIKKIYGEGKVLGAACPQTGRELGIKINGDPGMLVEGLEEGEETPFTTIAKYSSNVPLALWRFGGNSGKMYYELMDSMFKELTGAIFLDNYERNAPHEGIAKKHKAKTNNLIVYAPNTRVWSIHTDITPLNAKGEIDGNAVMGAAVPSIIQFRHFQTLPEDQRSNALRRWFSINGPGLKNQTGAMASRMGGTNVYSVENNLIPPKRTRNMSFQFAKAVMNGEIQPELSDDEALVFQRYLTMNQELRSTSDQQASLVHQKNELDAEIFILQKIDEMIAFRAADNAYWIEKRGAVVRRLYQDELFRTVLTENSVENNQAFWDKTPEQPVLNTAGQLLHGIENGEIYELQVISDDEQSSIVDGVAKVRLSDYSNFYRTVYDEINNNLQASITNSIMDYAKRQRAITFLEDKDREALLKLNQVGHAYFTLNNTLDGFIEYCENNNLLVRGNPASEGELIAHFRDTVFPQFLLKAQDERYKYLEEFVTKESDQYQKQTAAQYKIPKVSGLSKKLIESFAGTSNLAGDKVYGVAQRLMAAQAKDASQIAPSSYLDLDELGVSYLKNLIVMSRKNLAGGIDVENLAIEEVLSLYNRALNYSKDIKAVGDDALFKTFEAIESEVDRMSQVIALNSIRETKRSEVPADVLSRETQLLNTATAVRNTLRANTQRILEIEESLKKINQYATFVYNLYMPFGQVES